MDKAIWKITEEWSYFLGNVLVGVRVAFLPEYPLVLFLIKHRGVGAFLNKKIRNPNRGSPLNSRIDNWWNIKWNTKNCIKDLYWEKNGWQMRMFESL